MPYFPVDDGFSSHPKVTRLRRGPTRERAVGLWTLAGSWCAFNLTDGHIPPGQVEELGCTKAAAQWLVDVRLWHVQGHDCDACPQPEQGGWVFHEWAESGRNFTRDAVLQRRAAKAAAGAKGGRRSGETRRAATKQPASNAEARASQFVEPPSHPIPSHRNPLVTLVCRRLSGDARATTTTDDERAQLWAMWADAAGVDGDALAAELRLWLMRNAETDLRNPGAALVGWLRKARERLAAQAPLGCGRCDGGWLPDDVDTGRPVPCPDCRPHLRPVAS